MIRRIIIGIVFLTLHERLDLVETVRLRFFWTTWCYSGERPAGKASLRHVNSHIHAVIRRNVIVLLRVETATFGR